MYIVNPETGIVVPTNFTLGRWERQSVSLRVSDHYKALFSQFQVYFKGEMAAIGDQTLEKEIPVLEKLSTYSSK